MNANGGGRRKKIRVHSRFQSFPVREQILRTLRNFTAELGDELKEAMDVMGDLQLAVVGKKNKPAYKVAGPKMTSLAAAEKLCQYTFVLFRSSSDLIEQVQKLEA